MTSRSFDSLASERRRTIVRDDDVLNFTLRVAYLAYLMMPRPLLSTPNIDSEDREYRTRMSAAISSSLYSIGDLFKDVGRDGPRPVKFPEKLIKVLDQKMQNIAMGKDPGYTDQLIRRTTAMFWGAFKEQSFHRQIKENRKIEELILMFVTTSTSALRKDPQLSGDAWKVELNNQIAQFVRMLRECLRNVSHVQPELTARLEMYAAKLVPQASPDHGTEPPSTSSFAPALSHSVHDMPLVKVVGRLFEISEGDLQREINTLRRFCTEKVTFHLSHLTGLFTPLSKAALVDLKTCLKNINAGLPFPGRREDFENDAAFNHWKTTEQTHLSQLMVIMAQFKPELANSTPSDPDTFVMLPTQRPESLYSLRPDSPMSRTPSVGSRYSLPISGVTNADPGNVSCEDDEVSIGHPFTYIPPIPKKFYKRLLERCIDYDLKSMEMLAEDQEVSLGILSVKSLEILNECALRWRVLQPYRVSCFLDVIRYRYEREKVPLACIPEALSIIQRTVQETGLTHWPRTDEQADYLGTICNSIVNLFLSSLYHALESLPSLKPEEIRPFVEILEQVKESELLKGSQPGVVARLKDLSERVQVIAIHQYTEKSNDLFADPTPNRAMPLILITDFLEKQAKLLDKRFPLAILGHLDFVSLFLDTQVPLFLTDLEHSRRILLEESVKQPSTIPIDDIFFLFQRAKTLLTMHAAFCPRSTPDFDLPSFFEPFVKQWLLTTDNKTGQWVHAAISVDQFASEGPEGHSSSIIDLFDSLRSPINFLIDLEWPDPYQEARFFTSLSKTVSKSLEQYRQSVEELFMAEMFPRADLQLQSQKQTATFFMEKAKLSLQGEKKVEPFNFTAASCVKLNNIEAARKLLDNMYQQMQVDKFSEILRAHGPPVPEKQEKPRHLFTVKIVMAEGLTPPGSGAPSKLDTFVTLSDEHGVRFAKTRTIYETDEPTWNEAFDISVEGTLWLMASVRDRQLIGKHDTIARAYLCLDPRRYGDFLSHDEWVDFDTRGRIRLRISMEGEKDDLQFYFGRAFRSLKRAEGDMVRVFIDKMTPFIRQSLSLTVLKNLVKSGNLGIDYTKAFGNFTSVYKSYVGSNSTDIQIPLPQQEKPRLKFEGGLTDSDIEDSIAPLLSYLDSNMQVLNSSLTETAKEMVLSRLWKEILNIIEGLLVPPLSDSPSDMKPLSDKSVDVVFQWLKILLNFFYVDGEGPMSIESLQNQKFRDVMSIRLYYDWHPDALMEESVRALQTALKSASAVQKRAKSVYHQRNLGTIKIRKKEKAQKKETTNGEIILRILRMRPHTSEFLMQQLSIMNQIQT